jgi:hypothetical protein
MKIVILFPLLSNYPSAQVNTGAGTGKTSVLDLKNCRLPPMIWCEEDKEIEVVFKLNYLSGNSK